QRVGPWWTLGGSGRGDGRRRKLIGEDSRGVKALHRGDPGPIRWLQQVSTRLVLVWSPALLGEDRGEVRTLPRTGGIWRESGSWRIRCGHPAGGRSSRRAGKRGAGTGRSELRTTAISVVSASAAGRRWRGPG